jgi:hypothetical protein
MRPLICLLLALMVGSWVAGCASDPSQGYSFSPARQGNVRTIAVPVFGNKTFSHGVEVELTEAIVKEVQRTTKWRVVAARSADTTLSGTVTESKLKSLATSSGTGLVMEQGLELSVDFEWRDGRSGEVLIARKSFKSLQSFVPARGTGERLELGQHATVQELARSIVNELRSSW